MNRRSLTLPVAAVLLATAISVNDQDRKQMAITFDDLPFGYKEEALTDEVYALNYDHAGVRGAGHLDAITPVKR